MAAGRFYRVFKDIQTNRAKPSVVRKTRSGKVCEGGLPAKARGPFPDLWYVLMHLTILSDATVLDIFLKFFFQVLLGQDNSFLLHADVLDLILDIAA